MGVLKKHLFETQSLLGSPDHWNDVGVVLICPRERAVPSDLTILYGMPMILMILAIEVMVKLFRISYHLIWSFEKWFIFNLLQYLMHWLSEHCTNYLGIGRPQLTYIVPSRPVIIISVRPEIPPFLRDNLSLPFSLLLVIFDPLVLINSVYELA